MKQTIRYMNADELAKRMKRKTQEKSETEGKKEGVEEEGEPEFVVVDVRDDDFAGGNIKGAINEPSRKFLMNVDRLVMQTKEVPLVIFHCALSQVRGPKAARIYAETRKNILEGKDIDHEVAILRDGFTEFQAKYRKDPDLVEKWDKDYWEEWSEPQEDLPTPEP